MGKIIALFFGLVLLAALGSMISPSSASTSTLPSVQRTAIYAPVEATRNAGNQAGNVSSAQAQAQEQDAARVYAQAQQEQRDRLRTLATEQAGIATQTANNVSVSKEYATLMAVSYQATAETISQTMQVNRTKYSADVLAIQATQQAVADQTVDTSDKSATKKSLDLFWMWIGPIVVTLIIALSFLACWKLIGRIQPRIEEIEIEVPVTSHSNGQSDPVVDEHNGLNFTSADMRVLLTNIVMFSGRHIGWQQKRIAGSDEIGIAISDRAWGNAINWGKEHYDLVTQRGPIVNGGGTYAQMPMSELHNRLVLDPAFVDSPAPSG